MCRDQRSLRTSALSQLQVHPPTFNTLARPSTKPSLFTFKDLILPPNRTRSNQRTTFLQHHKVTAFWVTSLSLFVADGMLLLPLLHDMSASHLHFGPRPMQDIADRSISAFADRHLQNWFSYQFQGKLLSTSSVTSPTKTFRES